MDIDGFVGKYRKSISLDPYMQYRLNAASRIEDTDMSSMDQTTNPGANNDKKRTRGFTQMRGIWGRREGEERLEVKCNEYGQPNDEFVTKLSNFIGTLIRDGKNVPLSYSSWHKVPNDYKEKMWKLLQTKFNLNDSSKTWTMQKFGRKLRDWRSQLKRKCYRKGVAFEEHLKLKDPRVYRDHFEYLLNYWSSTRAQEISRKNQISHAFRTHNHTTGTKSFARVANEQENQLQHAPTRAELFRFCYTKKDGTQTEPVKNAISKMHEKEREMIDDPTEQISRNDSYAQVMGQDKNGRVRMFGAGVCPSLVFSDLSCRGANQNSTIKVLQEQNNELRKEILQLKSQAAYVPRHENVDSDSTQSPDDLSPIEKVANREDWSLASLGLQSLSIFDQSAQIGDVVCLKGILNPTKTIAIGVLYSTDPSKEVGGRELGNDHWEIYIQAALMADERLVRSYGHYKSIGHVVGDYIAWPKLFVISKEVDDRLIRVSQIV